MMKFKKMPLILKKQLKYELEDKFKPQFAIGDKVINSRGEEAIVRLIIGRTKKRGREKGYTYTYLIEYLHDNSSGHFLDRGEKMKYKKYCNISKRFNYVLDFMIKKKLK